MDSLTSKLTEAQTNYSREFDVASIIESLSESDGTKPSIHNTSSIYYYSQTILTDIFLFC